MGQFCQERPVCELPNDAPIVRLMISNFFCFFRCKGCQGQTNRDHEGWTPKIVAQGQGFDCEAKIPQGSRQSCPQTRCNYRQVPKTPATPKRKQERSQEIRLNKM